MGAGLMIEGQFFVILLFFPMFQIVLGLQFPVMFGYKNEEVVPVFLFMEFGMGQKIIQLGNIYHIQVKTLEK